MYSLTQLSTKLHSQETVNIILGFAETVTQVHHTKRI